MSDYIPDEVYEPTDAERGVANNMHGLVGNLMRGELHGIGIVAVATNGEHSCFYLNKPSELVLREPMERLRVMYETHSSFRNMDNAPAANRSYRMN